MGVVSERETDQPAAGEEVGRVGYLPITNDGKVWTDPPPAEISRVQAAAGLPTAATTLDVDVLLIRMGDRIVLIDSGLGALSATTGRLLPLRPPLMLRRVSSFCPPAAPLRA